MVRVAPAYLEVCDGDAVGLHGGPAGEPWGGVGGGDGGVGQRGVDVASVEARGAAGGGGGRRALLEGQLPVRHVEPSPGGCSQQRPPHAVGQQEVAGFRGQQRPGGVGGLGTVHVLHLEGNTENTTPNKESWSPAAHTSS